MEKPHSVMLAATCEEQAVSYQQEVFSFAELKTVISEILKAVRHLLGFLQLC